MVFYRKFRPQKFSDIIGQDHIVTTLTNSLSTGTYTHGYLFAGPRGTGKTTLARIFAKALNCSGRVLGRDSYEPCNKCLSCKEISQGKSLDLFEIDAASNRGIDEIRDLREKIRFAPTKSKYKIYIIDEVHMLTKEAFNALLKTLEEPPAHAIFIMATTEPHKILATILSRVQRFDFHFAEISELEKLIRKISKEENIKIADDATNLLASLAGGSYRDSLSLLDQIASTRKTAASLVTVELIQEILGLARDKSVFDFVEAIVKRQRKNAFEIVNILYSQGVDLENFTLKVIEVLRKIALLKFGENELFEFTNVQKDKIEKISSEIDIDELMELISRLAHSLADIKSAALPQLPIEMIIYEFTKNSYEKVENMVNIDKPDNSTQKITPVILSPTKKSSAKFNRDLWTEIVKNARSHNHSLAALLKDAVLAETNEDTIILAFKFKFHADVISGKRNTQIIEGIIQKITGDSYKLECRVDPKLVMEAPTNIDEEILNGAKEVFEVEE